MPETMAGGVVLFDFDNDGWLDVFFVNGGSFVDKKKAASAQHRFYRNNQDGTFAEVTAASGISVSGFGMGACSADYDNDGFPDLYITGADFSRLYRNTGKGSFVDVTLNAGVGSTLWNASCAFGDIDNDSDVDLYVTRYVDYTPEAKQILPALNRSSLLPSQRVQRPARSAVSQQRKRDIHRYQPRIRNPAETEWERPRCCLRGLRQ